METCKPCHNSVTTSDRDRGSLTEEFMGLETTRSRNFFLKQNSLDITCLAVNDLHTAASIDKQDTIILYVARDSTFFCQLYSDESVKSMIAARHSTVWQVAASQIVCLLSRLNTRARCALLRTTRLSWQRNK